MDFGVNLELTHVRNESVGKNASIELTFECTELGHQRVGFQSLCIRYAIMICIFRLQNTTFLRYRDLQLPLYCYI